MEMEGLNRDGANFVPLSPITFLRHAARVHPRRTAVRYGKIARDWQTTFRRCAQAAAAMRKNGISRGDVVSVVAPNVPELFESHFAVAMAGAVLNAINVRLDAETLRYIFTHGETKLILVDGEFAAKVAEAIADIPNPPMVVDIVDANGAVGSRIGTRDYEAFLQESDGEELCEMPDDEWAPIALNYTSGTTGKPKGVVYHHRGAYLIAMGSAVAWGMPYHNTFLGTVPMFHCNGWGYPWTQTLLAGTYVCIRRVDGDEIWRLIDEAGVEYFGGAPIVLSMIVQAAKKAGGARRLTRKVRALVAGAPPPPTVLSEMTKLGFEVTHVYGLTETYGHTTMCFEQAEWGELSEDEVFEQRAMQGVGYPILDDWTVLDADGRTVAADGKTMGELALRGNTVMSGYLKNPAATRAAFVGGWFMTGDLGVLHPNSYMQIKDRAKDIIISGGENISSVAVENALTKHPDIVLAAVVAKPDDKWGETPCAFVEVGGAGDGAAALSADDVIAFCKANLPGYMCPRYVVFGELPKTATGKIKKYELRERAKAL